MELTRDRLEKRTTQRRLEKATLEGIGTVYLLRLTGTECMEFTERSQKLYEDDKRGTAGMEMQIFMVWKCLADKDGRRLYTDDEYDTVRELLNDDLAEIALAALRVNGMGSKEAAAIAGKSETSDGGDSSSGSAST